MIDDQHNITTETDIENTAFQQRLNEVSAKAEEVKAKLRQQAVSSDSTTVGAIAAEADEEKEDLVRQHGDVTLYMFYMKSFHILAFCFWTSTSFLASFCELFPGRLSIQFQVYSGTNSADAYMRIWLDLHPKNNLYYAGYAGISCSAFFAAGMNVG